MLFIQEPQDIPKIKKPILVFAYEKLKAESFSQSILSDNWREFYYTKKTNSRSCKEKEPCGYLIHGS